MKNLQINNSCYEIPNTALGWLRLVFFDYKLVFILMLLLGVVWSFCEVVLPYMWAQGKVDFSCYLVWFLGQCILRLQGVVGAQFWPYLIKHLREGYWRKGFFNLNAKKLIAFNQLLNNLKVLLITIVYRLITPISFAIVTILALANLNKLVSVIILIWLIGHIAIMCIHSKIIFAMSEKVAAEKFLLETLERSSRFEFDLLVDSNFKCYKNNKALNIKIERVLFFQSLWLSVMLMVVYFFCDKVVVFVLWLQLINQVWNIGVSWHELIRNCGGINNLLCQI